MGEGQLSGISGQLNLSAGGHRRAHRQTPSSILTTLDITIPTPQPMIDPTTSTAITSLSFMLLARRAPDGRR